MYAVIYGTVRWIQQLDDSKVDSKTDSEQSLKMVLDKEAR